jgi:hypothetical protein
MNVSHYVICRPGQTAAHDRLKAAGVTSAVYPAIVPNSAFQAFPFVTFNESQRDRTIKESGILLAILGVLGAGVASGAEWIGLWEEDVELAEPLNLQEISLPVDCGVLYLGGALWSPAENYGRPFAGKVWQMTAPEVISCCHAVLIRRSAAQDILPVMASMTMTADDLLSLACIRAQHEKKWTTCFLNPWLAWQSNRPETRPLTV